MSSSCLYKWLDLPVVRSQLVNTGMRKNETDRTCMVGMRWHDLASIDTAVIEPASANDVTDFTPSGSEDQPTSRAALALHDSDAKCPNLSFSDNDLRFLIGIWSGLSADVRRALLALATSSVQAPLPNQGGPSQGNACR